MWFKLDLSFRFYFDLVWFSELKPILYQGMIVVKVKSDCV